MRHGPRGGGPKPDLPSGQAEEWPPEEGRGARYETYLQGQDMVRAFPTEAELHVWLQRLPEDSRRAEYAQGIQEVLDQTGLIDGTDVVAQHWAKIIAAGESAALIHVRDGGKPDVPDVSLSFPM